jgi:hypothetical protein
MPGCYRNTLGTAFIFEGFYPPLLDAKTRVFRGVTPRHLTPTPPSLDANREIGAVERTSRKKRERYEGRVS